MTEDKLKRLKEVLSVPTKSRQETLMIEYLKEVLTEKGYDFTVDNIGNIYVTKGDTEWFPCFVSHTDTVHSIDHGLTVIETKTEDGETILTGVNKDTMKPSGIGGDDKCGVFLCLEMLDTFDNVKAAFFVSEEIGCIGSKQADPEFFKNVGYAIQYDSPEGNSMSFTLMGKELFSKESEFGEKVSDLILEAGIDKWAYHPYTDIWQLLEKFDFSCLNLAAGYYNMHSAVEFVVVEDVDNAYNLGLALVETLGENKYERPKRLLTENKPWWKSGSGNKSTYNTTQSSTKQKLIEETKEDPKNGVSNYLDDDEDWADFFDYDDFNGGYSIRHYGSQSDYDFDW